MPRTGKLLIAAAAAGALLAGLVVASPAAAQPVSAAASGAASVEESAALAALETSLSTQVATRVSPLPSVPAWFTTWSTWDPGNLINDALFWDGHAMDAAAVQSFLDSKVAACDYSRARAECLKSYSQTTPTMSADDGKGSLGNVYCTAIPGSATPISAARIIAEIGAACGVSQKVLLVTLQKEQSLVTDTWPYPSQYANATGFGCPDTAPCDPAYNGFFYQVYYAARQFQVYQQRSNLFNYAAGGTYQIQYSPIGGCGTGTVRIANAATAALYNYTPYTPNVAAIQNPYGTGDSCSAYGNRNFVVFWWDWFGDPHGGDVAWVKAIFADLLDREPTTDELYRWNGVLASGTSKRAIELQFLRSDEFRTRRINEIYQDVLGRPADPDGAAYWLGEVKAGRIDVDWLPTFFYASDEFYASVGNNPTAYVKAVYQAVLGRPTDPEGLAYWVKVFPSIGRQSVLNAIFNSLESSQRRVEAMYQMILGRMPDLAGRDYWAQLLPSIGDNEVRSLLVESQEYATRAATRFGADD